MAMKPTPAPREIFRDVQYNLIDVKLFQRDVLDRSDFILLNTYASNEEKVEMLLELMRKKSEEDHNNFLEIMGEDYDWLKDKCEIYLQKIRLEALLNNKQAAAVPSSPCVVDVIAETESSTEENDRSSPAQRQSPSSPDSIALPVRPIKEEILSKSSSNVPNKLNQIITPEVMTIVRRNHRIVRRWTTLAHNLGMSSVVHTLRMRVVLSGEDLDACVLHLLEEWKGAHPKEATVGKLISELRREDFNDVADELEEKFAG